MKTPIEKAIYVVGSQIGLAARIGLKQQHVWHWLNKMGGRPSSDFAIPVSEATNWAVTPHELRPDIYPHPDDGLPEHLRGRNERGAA